MDSVRFAFFFRILLPLGLGKPLASPPCGLLIAPSSRSLRSSVSRVPSLSLSNIKSSLDADDSFRCIRGEMWRDAAG